MTKIDRANLAILKSARNALEPFTIYHSDAPFTLNEVKQAFATWTQLDMIITKLEEK